MATGTNIRPLVTAGMVLGIGTGGFADGIFFHQLLQVHNMLSAIRPKDSIVNVEINMFWDGLFHAVCLVLTVAGLFLLFKASKTRGAIWSGKVLGGAMLSGWGLFNLVEGVIDHHILGIHHVVERFGLSAWDYAFLGSGVALVIAGCILIRNGAGDSRL